MVLNLIALLLIAAVTFVQSIFGLFSGLLSAFCSVFAAVVAFGFYEALNDVLTKQLELHPAYTEPISLLLLFIVTLAALRYLADTFIRGNVNVPQYVDWAGAGIFGFISAQICVGMAVICTLMLPIGGSVLGFSRYDRSEEGAGEHPGTVRWERSAMWTRCDEMTVGLVSLLSNGSLSTGSTAFGAVYPDYMDAVFYSTNTVMANSSTSPFREKGDGFTNGLKVTEWWEQATPLEGRYRKEVPTLKESAPPYDRMTYSASSGKKLLGVRLALLPNGGDRNKSQRLHLFRPGMLRLVGRNGDSYEQYPARVIGNADDKIEYANRIADLDNNFSLPGDNDRYVDVYFEVKDGFTPMFCEYRHHARAAMPAERDKAPPVALKGGNGPTGTGTGGDVVAKGGSGGKQGGLMFGSLMEFPYGDNKSLPLEMSPSKTKKGETTVEGEAFVSGRIFGTKEALAPDNGEPGKLTFFKVPDKKRLCQVHYKPKKALSVVGEVFAYAAQLNQYRAVDDRGNQIPLAGYWVKIKRGNNDYYEIFYNGDPENNPPNPTYNSMIDVKAVEQKELRDQDDAEICLLFLTSPGVTVRRVENQKGEGGDVSIHMTEDPTGP